MNIILNDFDLELLKKEKTLTIGELILGSKKEPIQVTYKKR